jgi:hypothetical protein
LGGLGSVKSALSFYVESLGHIADVLSISIQLLFELRVSLSTELALGPFKKDHVTEPLAMSPELEDNDSNAQE